MPTQQLVYEGKDLQALIQRVVDEHGPARIRPPVRKRKGGLFGFFAKEVYVISVDAAATERAAAGRAAQEDEPVSVPTGRPAVPAVAHTGGSAALPASTADPALPAPPGSLAALIDGTEDDLTLDGSGAMGTNGPATAGSTPPAATGLPTPAAAGGSTPGGVPPAGGTAASTARPTVAGGPAVGAPAAPARSVKPFSQVLREVASSLGEEPGTYRPDPEQLRPAARLAPAAPVMAAPAPAAPAVAAPAATTGRATPAGRPAPSCAPPPLVIEGMALPVAELLRAAGFPEGLLELGAPAPGGSTLEAVFARLPQPPALPSLAGALVAVVGDARLVRPVARAVAAMVGCPVDDIAVAARGAGARHQAPDRRVATPSEAAALAPGWRRGRTGVVAVYAPPLGADQSWTRDVLDALRPSCVWGTASATTKPDDVRRFMDAVGGVDALAVTEVTATASPAAVLATRIPVARLDDEMATPQRWAAVVADLVARR